jgi:hypothetical protein
MRNLLVVLFVSLASFACASGALSAAERDELMRLRADAAVKTSDDGGVMAPASVAAMTAPPAGMIMPERVASLYGDVPGCSRSLTVRLRNGTSAHLAVMFDGRPIVVRGAEGFLPTLPPGATAAFCVSDPNHGHVVAGWEYGVADGQLVRTGQFRFDEGGWSAGSSYSRVVEITPYKLGLH